MTEAFQARNRRGISLLECIGTILLGAAWSIVALIFLIPGSILGAVDNFCSGWRNYRESRNIARGYRARGETDFAKYHEGAAKRAIRSLPLSTIAGFFEGFGSCCYLVLVPLPACIYTVVVELIERRSRPAQA